MQEFVHEKLDVYRTALSFLGVVDRILEEVPRGRGHLGDQLDRAATSIVLDVAEGVGDATIASARELLLRVVAMLTRMILQCIDATES